MSHTSFGHQNGADLARCVANDSDDWCVDWSSQAPCLRHQQQRRQCQYNARNRISRFLEPTTKPNKAALVPFLFAREQRKVSIMPGFSLRQMWLWQSPCVSPHCYRRCRPFKRLSRFDRVAAADPVCISPKRRVHFPVCHTRIATATPAASRDCRRLSFALLVTCGFWFLHRLKAMQL